MLWKNVYIVSGYKQTGKIVIVILTMLTTTTNYNLNLIWNAIMLVGGEKVLLWFPKIAFANGVQKPLVST